MPSPVDQIPQTTQDFLQFKELLYALVVLNKYQKVVETGTDVGDLTRILSTALQATQGQLLSLDLKPVGSWAAEWPVKNVQFQQGDSRTAQVAGEFDLLVLDAQGDAKDLAALVREQLDRLGVWVKVGGKVVICRPYHQTYGQTVRETVEEWAKRQGLCWTVYPQGQGMLIIEITHLLRPTP